MDLPGLAPYLFKALKQPFKSLVDLEVPPWEFKISKIAISTIQAKIFAEKRIQATIEQRIWYIQEVA